MDYWGEGGDAFADVGYDARVEGAVGLVPNRGGVSFFGAKKFFFRKIQKKTFAAKKWPP